MRPILLTLLLALEIPAAIASSPLSAPLETLACSADHIFVGHVAMVDLVDGAGRVIEDESQGTGPRSWNRIQLHIVIDEVITSNMKAFPQPLKVSLDPFMHFRLGQIRQAHSGASEKRLVLLKGDYFKPIVPGNFLRDLDQRSEILEIRKRCRP